MESSAPPRPDSDPGSGSDLDPNQRSDAPHENETTCAICYESNTHLSQALVCGHKFHVNCIVPALQRDRRCPVCRDHSLPDSMCCICLGAMDEASDQVTRLDPCSHMFHSECLIRYLRINNQCPECAISAAPTQGSAQSQEQSHEPAESVGPVFQDGTISINGIRSTVVSPQDFVRHIQDILNPPEPRWVRYRRMINPMMTTVKYAAMFGLGVSVFINTTKALCAMGAKVPDVLGLLL